MKASGTRSGANRLAWLAMAAWLTMSLTGCGGFFVCEKTSCTTSTSTTPDTATGDYAYVANAATGSTFLSEYNVAAGTLAAISGSPFSLGYVPVALTVSRNNHFLYVASATTIASPGIYLYTIGSTGALTAANGGAILTTAAVTAMATSPDGQFLFTVDNTGKILSEYAISTSTGLITGSAQYLIPGTSCGFVAGITTPALPACGLTVSPGSTFVVAALNTAGDSIFPYSSTAASPGIQSSSAQQISYTTPTVGDFSVAMDSNDYGYFTQTSGLQAYAISSGAITAGGGTTYATGSVPRSAVLSTDEAYVYTANAGTSDIAAYSITGAAVLTAVTGSPVTAASHVSVLGVDNTGKYLLAAGYDASSGLRLYTIGTTGGLTQNAAAATGASLAIPNAMALTH